MAKAMLGTGTTLVFPDQQFTVWVAEDGIGYSAGERAMVDVTPLNPTRAGPGQVGSREYVADDVVDPGTLNVTAFHDPDRDIGDLAILTDPLPWTLTFPKRAGEVDAAYWSGMGYVQPPSIPSIRVGDSVKVSFSIKLTGAVSKHPATRA